MDDLVNSFPDFEHVGVGRDDGIRKGEHMAVFYKSARFTKVKDGMFWLNETTDKPGLGWDAKCNRTVTWIELQDKVTRKNFYVFDTHFDNSEKIDFVFVNPKVEVLRHGVLSDSFGLYYPSDHLPVLVEVKID